MRLMKWIIFSSDILKGLTVSLEEWLDISVLDLSQATHVNYAVASLDGVIGVVTVVKVLVVF